MGKSGSLPGWQLCRGISGSFRVEWVAGFVWNQWQLWSGIRNCGYRSDNRYLVFQCLQHTLGLSAAKWRVLDQAHRKRNLAEYEGEIDLSPALVQSVLKIAEEIEEAVLRLTTD
ncbi:hypothetical protein SAMN04487869_11998 [Marinobacter sp. DSM 26671]|uniref:hypothetical protein n=1 Tax=Marinobacter sp. DSM 26671 TaxID=1761793 RepID=UPI0008EB8578|nr:hypothetical protein [Marinobacter sp. DSM 26671]SFE83502.1 hypothetical protein SAMN04487869_11998 [Marinobacter sp. DSM 26671]